MTSDQRFLKQSQPLGQAPGAEFSPFLVRPHTGAVVSAELHQQVVAVHQYLQAERGGVGGLGCQVQFLCGVLDDGGHLAEGVAFC